MLTFYARHSMDVSDDTIARLWREGWVAIHYPEMPHGVLGESDSRSIDPRDYKGKAKGALNALLELASDGGYVCAEYDGYDEVVVGVVPPRTRVQLFEGNWGGDNFPETRAAVLKAIRLERVRRLPPSRCATIMSGRPRQGTLQRWGKAGQAIQYLVDGQKPSPTLSSLLPAQQEVMCSEFLLSPAAHNLGLPKIVHHLLPVGRTLKDLDIYGISETGEKICAQVTYSSRESAASKLEALLRYKEPGAVRCLLFCLATEVAEEQGIIIVPLDSVFREFTSMDSGATWLEYALRELS